MALYEVRVAEEFEEEYSACMTPAIEKRVIHILSTHPKWGPSVFPNPDAQTPFEGDYMLEFFIKGYVCRFWYFVDEEQKTTNIVNVYRQRFGMM